MTKWKHIKLEAYKAAAEHLERNTIINCEDRAVILEIAREIFASAAARTTARGLGKQHIQAVLDCAAKYGEAYLRGV